MSRSTRPVVAVSADLRELAGFDWHAAPAPYVAALAAVASVQPLIVPALGADADPQAVLAHVDGLLLTGSRSNVHPARYGAREEPGHPPFDEARDATVLPLIEAALAGGLPLFAICRGMQELNVALGGSLVAEVRDLPGRADHSAPDHEDQDVRFALRQQVIVRPEGPLAALVGEGPLTVNTVHHQAVDRLGGGRDVEARAQDGTVEAVWVRDAADFALGVQWHPEYWAGIDSISRRLFEAFGDAVRRRAGAAPAR